jgi:dipeptidyl aminopeptidase/acylaminoacyl peptidase
MNPLIRPQTLWGVTTAFRGLISITLLALLISPSVSYAAFPGTNGRIVFDGTQSGGIGQIYTMNPDGSAVSQLTSSSGGNGSAEWSADGTKIVFTSIRDGNPEVYLMNADGTGQSNLTNDTAIDDVPTFSPDGTKIAFTTQRDGNEEIYVMNADGTGPVNRTNNSAADAQPAWSPDGTKIAFESTRNGLAQIFVMNANGTSVTQLTTLFRNGGVNWSPDGTKIAFHSDRDCSGCGTYFDIYSMNADGTGQTRLAFDPVYATGPAWSPDGTKIVFDSQRDSNYEVYVMNADGTGQTNLTNHPAVDFRANWGTQPVTYNFAGFFQPVDNLPTLNSVNPGRAIPVKFSLGGEQGLNIFAAGYPKSEQIACNSNAIVDGIEQTVTAGSSSLSYDASTDIYTYVWKTENAWAGTCRQLVVKLNDGTFHRANFKFR